MKKRIILLTLAVLLTALLLLTSSFAAGDDASLSADQGSVTTNEDITIYTVTIEYVYGDNSKFKGQRVAVPYIAEVAAGDTLTGTVTSPNCVGYTPNKESYDLSTLGLIDGHTNVVVTYDPAEVSYTVRHYQQNIDNDEYTWVDTTMATGYTEALTSDAAAKTYTGFTALPHYHEEIAADSSTMIDIYYDRDYYLMSFDLQGGFGVEPIYARYGAPISVGTPYQPGWNFKGWNQTIPSTMPAMDTSYTASWTASKVPFTVAYWLEDANVDGKYNFWDSTTQMAYAGATVQGSTYQDYTKYLTNDQVNAMDTYEKRYSYYNEEKTDTDVTIKGDGSTVVNVYYNRKVYTLKFYYAARTGNEGAYTYKIFGGSTYAFGQDNSSYYNGDELLLLNNMYYNKSGQWGEITASPALNSIGESRVTSKIYTQDFDSNNNVDYLYISFTAKYGEDISGAWPCNVFDAATRKTVDNNTNGWKGTAAYVSAWNGEHHVYYSQHNENETIKGNYNELDYQLLFDNCGTHNYEDSSTIAYLCFWENGSGNVGWNVPELYRYNIYVPVLTGQEPNQIQREDGAYYLWATYDTCDNSTVSEQTAPAINGFTYTNTYTSEALHKYHGNDPSQNILANINDSPILFDEAGNQIYREAYSVNFFYSRDQYNLTFVNGDKTAQVDKVFFGADISRMAPAVTYPDQNQADFYEFSGWYTSAEAFKESRFDLDGATMPDSNLILYAGWNLITHDVKIYDTEDCTNQIGTTVAVAHDEPVPEASRPSTSELKHPTDPSATFIGWFYKDENGKEQAFDFATMTITRDMAIYAKWRSNEMKQVNIRYVIENEDGTETEIADSETLMLRLGQTRTFEAKTGSSLFLEYRSGCFPTTASHSITIKNEDIDDENPVTYTFVYKQYGKVPYQVEFYVQLDTDADGDGKLDLRSAFKNENGKAVFVSVDDYKQDSTYNPYVEEHRENDKAVVTELYVPDGLKDPAWTLPDEYFPNALKIQKVIVPSETNPDTNIEANVIQFIYTYTDPVNPDNPSNPVYEARYLVQHFIQNPSEQTQYDLYSYSDEEGLSGEKATASPISIPGYTFSSAETNTRMQTGTNLADNVMSGTITADDSLELNFYYTVNSYPYQVMYLEKDTNRVLAGTKTEGADGKPLTGYYGAKVTESYIEILGYEVDAPSKSLYIQMEAGDTASVNTIVFYYSRMSADLIVSKTVELDAEQAKEEGISQLPEAVLAQEFTFTVTCPTGFHKSVYDCTVTEGDKETTKDVVAGTTTMTFTLKHGQTIKIHDLAMGDYTVAETYVPGFRTSVNQRIQQEYPVNLETNNVDVTAPFLNSYPFYTGDLVIMKKVAKADTSDPNATEPYKVTVVLTPEDAAREVNRVITFVDKDGKPLTDANNNSSFTIPKITGTDDQTEFCITLLVPVGGEVKMKGVPVGSFTATEEVKGTVGYIFDYYTVKYNKAVHQNDEVTGTNHAVNGVIHGGHPTAVTFNNTYKKGTLTINKTVGLEYANDTWTGDTFTFAITGTTELPDGNYSIKVGDATSTVNVKDSQLSLTETISVSKTEGKTSWSESLTFENLPAGYYTVTETAAGLGLGAYTVVPEQNENCLVNSTDEATEVNFTNTYKRKTGNLKVTKAIEIVGGESVVNADKLFTFAVSLLDGELSDSYTCEVKTSNGTSVSDSSANLTAQDNVLTFQLKHGQYIVINNLPVGQYEVRETQETGYASHFNGAATAAETTNVTVTAEGTAELACTNKYPVNFGKLSVTKNVVTPADHSALDQAPEDDEFTFTVQISGYSSELNLSSGILATFYDKSDSTGKKETIALNNNTLTFELKDGERVELELPACTYTIIESGMDSVVNTSGVLADHYTTAYTVENQTAAAGNSHTLVAGEVETVVFTNTYKQHLGRLTINKTLNNPTVTSNSSDSKDFLFHVTGNGVDMDVIVPGGGSVTIYDLPLGEYTVTEDTDWNWRYSLALDNSNDRSVPLTIGAPNVTVTFKNTYSNNQWLNFFHNVLNEFPKSN